MGEEKIERIILTSLKKIKNPKGDIFHAMKETDNGYKGFGEAYFSFVKSGQIKGWNKHKHMTLNLIVPIGAVKFVIINDRIKQNNLMEVKLSIRNYQRLTVPPGLWVGFQGISNTDSMILNIANISHDPIEKENKSLDEIDYNWRIT